MDNDDAFLGSLFQLEAYLSLLRDLNPHNPLTHTLQVSFESKDNSISYDYRIRRDQVPFVENEISGTGFSRHFLIVPTYDSVLFINPHRLISAKVAFDGVKIPASKGISIPANDFGKKAVAIDKKKKVEALPEITFVFSRATIFSKSEEFTFNVTDEEVEQLIMQLTFWMPNTGMVKIIHDKLETNFLNPEYLVIARIKVTDDNLDDLFRSCVLRLANELIESRMEDMDDDDDDEYDDEDINLTDVKTVLDILKHDQLPAQLFVGSKSLIFDNDEDTFVVFNRMNDVEMIRTIREKAAVGNLIRGEIDKSEASTIKTVLEAIKSDKVGAKLDLSDRWFLSCLAGTYQIEEYRSNYDPQWSTPFTTKDEEEAVKKLMEYYLEYILSDDEDDGGGGGHKDHLEVKTVTDALNCGFFRATLNCVNNMSITFDQDDEKYVVSLHTPKRKSSRTSEELIRTTSEEVAVAKVVDGTVLSGNIKTFLDLLKTKNGRLSSRLRVNDKWLFYSTFSNSFVVNMDDNSKPNHVVELIKTTNEEEAVAKLIEGYCE